MKFVIHDYETASSCDLKHAGAWRYGEDPTTEILCLGVMDDEGNSEVYSGNDLAFEDHKQRQSLLYRAWVDPKVFFIAHNCAFEKSIWRNLMTDWPVIPNERYHDTQAACAMKGLPLKLERAAMALHLEAQKDMEGSRVTLSLSRPNKKGFLDRSPDKLARVRTYNLADLDAEVALHRRVRGLGESERQVWLLDQRINERGVRLDTSFIDASQSIVAQATGPLLTEFRALTGVNPTQRDKFMAWLHENGCAIPNLKKETIDEWLGDHDDEEDILAGDDDDFAAPEPQLVLPFQFERALRVRKILGSASIKKLGAMRACLGEDGRARGLLQYHGAGPGRWAGRLFQPQNFARPSLKVDGDPPDQNDVIDAIMTRDAEYVEMMFGEPINCVTSALRHAIIASEGCVLSCGDYQKIECVIVLAMAGATETAERVIKMGSQVYLDMSNLIFPHLAPVKKTDLKEYTIGKNSILGCGFQMGWRKFLARYWKEGSEDEGKEVIRVYREDFAPEVPRMWRGLEGAAVDTVWTGQAHMAYGITYALEDGWLTARLPSGRKLWYRDPIKVRKAMPWDKTDVRPGFEYKAWKKGQWTSVSAYGGLLTENVVQATARDLLVHGMFNLEREYAPLILSVHDEAVCDGPRNDVKAFDQIMCERPQWAKSIGIPVAADCWTGDRYRK